MARNSSLLTKILAAGAIAAQLTFSVPRADSVPRGCSLTLHVDGFRNQKGVIGCALFSSSKGWPEDDDKPAPLVESFSYVNLRLDVGVAKETFER